MKWPEHLRPTYDEVDKRLTDRISPEFFQLLVKDIQTDCDCDVERYDNAEESTIVALTLNGVESLFDQWSIKMIPEINDQHLWDLFKRAIECAPEKQINHDILLVNMLYNPASDGHKLWKKYKEITNMDPLMHRDGRMPGWYPAKFVSVDWVYFTPDQEFFGVVTANVDKFGAFCIPQNMLKVKL